MRDNQLILLISQDVIFKPFFVSRLIKYLKNNDIKDFCVNSPIVGDAVRTLYDKYLQNKNIKLSREILNLISQLLLWKNIRYVF